ncbi:MAG: DUF2029 domain-containing protein [Spirochaetales bacterium]|nr:DUF2029 domain-containing protein [Spirochaetales bacterium]
MKRKFAMLGIALLSLFLACSQAPVDENKEIIPDGEFNHWDGELPRGWKKNIWSDGYPAARIAQGSGKTPVNDIIENKYVILDNPVDADNKLVYTAPVRPNSLYRLSVIVKIMETPVGGRGASLSVLDTVENFPDLKSTNDSWQKIELYGRTGPRQTTLDVAVRLGGYGAVTKGKAAFDNFSLRALNAAPSGVRLWNFYSEEENFNDAPRAEESKINKTRDQVSTQPVWGTILFSAIFLLIFGASYFFLFKNKKLGHDIDKKKLLIMVLIVLLAALGIRVVMGYTIEGQSGDLSCFKGWGDHAYSTPWPDYYGYWSAYQEKAQANGDYWCDYPPVYVMILTLLSALRHLFGFSHGSAGYTLLIKMPNIISDVVITYLIFSFAKGKFKHGPLALGLALLYALNPAIIINSAIWGQADAIYTMLALLIVHFMSRDKYWLSGLILGIAILIKIQTAFVAFALLYSLIAKKDLKTWLLTVAAGVGIFVLATLPFAVKLPPEWIIIQLIGTLTGYPYASVNAYNFFAILGGNWKATGSSFTIPFSELNALFISLAALAGFYGWAILINLKKGIKTALKAANSRLKVLAVIWGSFFVFFAIGSRALRASLATSLGFNLPYLSWDWIGVLLGTLLLGYSILIFVKGKEFSKNYFISLLLITGIFMVIPGMHERYLYAAILFSLMTYIYTEDRRFMVLFLASSFSVLLNVYHVYDIFHIADKLGNFPDYPLQWNQPLMFFNGIFNSLMFAYMIWTGYDYYIKGNRVPFLGIQTRLAEENRGSEISSVKTNSPGASLQGKAKALKLKDEKDDIIMDTDALDNLDPSKDKK